MSSTIAARAAAVPVLAAGAYTKLQAAVHFDVRCSSVALEVLNLAFENHNISDASSVVQRFQVFKSNGYRVIVDFICSFVPVDLVEFPNVVIEGCVVMPTDPITVVEAIVDHDGQLGVDVEQPDCLHLVSPEGKEVLVSEGAILSNIPYWGSRWQCIATAKTTHKRCRNRTHDVLRVCLIHREAGVDKEGEEYGVAMAGLKLC